MIAQEELARKLAEEKQMLIDKQTDYTTMRATMQNLVFKLKQDLPLEVKDAMAIDNTYLDRELLIKENAY